MRRIIAPLAVSLSGRGADDAIRARATLLEPVTVRSLDALHLATAIEIGDALDAVITYDERMATAAASLGLVVLAPASARPRHRVSATHPHERGAV